MGQNLCAQVFTQTFVDRCTGDVKIVTANFVNGSATVAFYDKIKVFTYNQYLNGELQAWLIQTYNWWNALSPCSSTQTQVQQAQQTAQAAQQAAQTASTAASTASTAATTASTAATNATQGTTATTGTTQTTGGTTGSTSGGTSGSTSGGSSSGGGESSGGSGSSGGGSGEGSGGSGEGSGGGSGEGSGEGSGGGETQQEETKTEETKEETKTEETKEESKEETKEESKEESKEEEKSEEEKKEEKKKEKEEKKKQRALSPIQLKADMMSMQNPLGGYNAAINFGASQSSVFGDVSYGANLMVFDNLRQATFALNRSKVYMDESYNVDWIESIGLSYGNNFGTQSTSGNFMRLKPMGKKGTVGLGINYTYMFGGMLEKPMGSMGYNLLYANSITMNGGRLTYSPAFIISQTPISFTLNDTPNIPNYKEQSDDILLPSVVSTDAMFILSNSFTYQITRRFSVNFGYTAIKSTNPLIPLINSFMIGSKLPF